MQNVVLVAERDPLMRLLLSGAMTELGFRAVEAENWRQAVLLCEQQEPDLVLLGEGMEEARGKMRQMPWPIGLIAPINGSPAEKEAFGSRIRQLSQINGIVGKLGAAMDAFPDEVFFLERDGTCRGRNPAVDDGKPLTRRFGSDAAELILGRAGMAMRDKKVLEAEFAVDAGGGKRNYEARLAPIGEDEALLLVRDITERKLAEEKVRYIAYFDSLTGLPNRQAFLASLESELKRNEKDNRKFAVLFLDVDSFKTINELFGRSVGDHLLQGVAERLKGCVRQRDMISRLAGVSNHVARHGGDEFTVLLSDIERVENAFLVAKRFKEAMAHPFVVDSQHIVLSSSIGIALYPEDSRDAAQLLKFAEFAMNRAKDSGKDRIQLYSGSLTKKMLYRRDLESSLRRALEKDEFTLEYQPQIDVASSRVLGAEALVRWKRSGQILVPPNEFIPFAEETGLILPIGEWVLKNACAWAGNNDGVRVSVNVSSHQIRDKHFEKTVFSILEETGIAPDRLELELTENALMNCAESGAETLRSLMDEGIHFAVDRFGTGYSSMSQLKRFHLGKLKIDRSLVAGIEADPDNADMIQAIIAMAHGLKMDVIAVGVETAGQRDLLSRYGCTQAQGFLFGGRSPR